MNDDVTEDETELLGQELTRVARDAADRAEAAMRETIKARGTQSETDYDDTRRAAQKAIAIVVNGERQRLARMTNAQLVEEIERRVRNKLIERVLDVEAEVDRLVSAHVKTLAFAALGLKDDGFNRVALSESGALHVALAERAKKAAERLVPKVIAGVTLDQPSKKKIADEFKQRAEWQSWGSTRDMVEKEFEKQVADEFRALWHAERARKAGVAISVVVNEAITAEKKP